ncbi:MAG: hypothetical protein EOP83_16200 [Verrucomicrobiaceae bacterium]|nr:MAG: hypothetical protein EOP83_16200 [Verrucomicrobiaceae bacterium]
MSIGDERDEERKRVVEMIKTTRETLEFATKLGLPPGASIDPLNVLRVLEGAVKTGIDPEDFADVYRRSMMKSLGLSTAEAID